MVWKRMFLSNIGIFGVQRLVLEGVPDKREKETHRLKKCVGSGYVSSQEGNLEFKSGESRVCDVP